MGVRTSSAPAVVVTADLELLDHVLAVAAAAGVEPQVVADAGALRPLWAAAPTIVVGVDQAARVASLVLPHRPQVFVVGEDADRDEVCAWSLPLGAAVVLLPGGANRLTIALADANGAGPGSGRVVAVVGGSGGVGASTCAAALAVTAAQRGLASLLVDADPLSGGIDLLVAAERLPGWRWPRLSTARGHLGNLVGHLPQVDGLDVLSMDRATKAEDGPDAEQMKAVLQSATRSHRLVVVDVPRSLTSAGREALRRADVVLLVALAQLRGIAAAQQIVAQLNDACAGPLLLVRLTRPRNLSPDAVADGLGLDLLAAIPDDASVALGAARGEAPGRSARSPLGRSCRTVLEALTLTGRANVILALDPIRARLAELGRPHTPADVAAAMRAEGLVVSDGALIETVEALRRHSVGAGLLEPLLRLPGVTDVLVNGPRQVYLDRGDGLELTGVTFSADDDVRRLAQRLAASVGRRLDDAVPFVDARLPDGTRVHAVLATLAAPGTCLSLRVPARRTFSLQDCVDSGSLTPVGADVLRRLVEARLAFLISGGTGSGKTTLLSALLGLVPTSERIVIVEDSRELAPDHPHVVRLEGRPANAELTGAVTLTQLVRQSLRMRPDRLVVGEVRGAEICDLLTAMNTGHEGGCGTVHANSAADVPTRLEALAALGQLGREALHAQVASALHAVVHIARDDQGRRRIREVHVFVRDPVTGLVHTETALEFGAGGETRLGPGAARLEHLLSQ